MLVNFGRQKTVCFTHSFPSPPLSCLSFSPLSPRFTSIFFWLLVCFWLGTRIPKYTEIPALGPLPGEVIRPSTPTTQFRIFLDTLSDRMETEEKVSVGKSLRNLSSSHYPLHSTRDDDTRSGKLWSSSPAIACIWHAEKDTSSFANHQRPSVVYKSYFQVIEDDLVQITSGCCQR